MNTAEEQRDYLVRRLENLVQWGIFPQARSAAYGILRDYQERFPKGEEKDSDAD